MSDKSLFFWHENIKVLLSCMQHCCGGHCITLQIMGLDARKPVFGVCEQHRRRPTCASVIFYLVSVSEQP